MNIQLPPSFVTPLQHLLTDLVLPLSIYSDDVMDDLFNMLQERMASKFYRDRRITRQDIHNNCLGLLFKLLRDGRLTGAALCEVKDVLSGRYFIRIQWASERTWSNKISEQKWDTSRDFLFEVGAPDVFTYQAV